MQGYGPSSYGTAFADVYDEWYGDRLDTEATVDRLLEWSDGAPLLEYAVGTGRVAARLAARGAKVIGLDSSIEMVRRLRSTTPGLPVVLADMAQPPFAGPVGLVYVVYNSFFNLTSETAQRQCLEATAAILGSGRRLVIEAFVPADADRDDDQVGVHTLAADRVVLAVSRRRPAAQTVDGQFIELSADGIRLRPWRIRYLRPEQLDAMAQAAGLALEARCGGWAGEAFDDESVDHVSVYRRV